MKISSFTIWLLGLESEIYEGIGAAEKSKYNGISIKFILLLLLGFIGIYRFFDYAFQNAFASYLASITLLLVVFTMYRFSLVSYRKSVFEYVEINKNAQINLADETHKIKGSINIKNKAKIGAFSASMFLRLLIFLPLSFIIVFALSTYLYEDYVEKICYERNQEYKKQAIQAIQTNYDLKQSNACKKIIEIYETVNTLKAANRQNTILFKLKIRELILYQTYHGQDSIDLKKAVHSIEIAYQKDQKYLLLLFHAMNKTVAFWTLLILFNLLFFFIHFELYSLKTGEEFQYAQLSTKAYRELITENYKVAMDEANSFVKKYKKFELPLNYSKDAFLDPPFCQIPKYTNTPKEKIAIIKLPVILNVTA